MATDIQTGLVYAVDDKSRPYYYAKQKTEEDNKKNPHHHTISGGTSREVDILVRDGRGKKLSLDANSFELVEQKTSLSTDDFYNDPQKITSVYYSEMEETIKKATGAAHVKIWHHQVRNQDLSTGTYDNLNTPVQGYAHAIHSDSHPQQAEEMFLNMGNPEFRTGRFLYINAWRNISETPIGDNHLAVCDESSLVKPDDYITSDIFTPGYHSQQYKLNSRNSAQHRWYYFSKMKKDEVILFKQWDSDRTLPGRVCFHTAFRDPNASKDVPARQSIEVRGFAYFPDHEPNTCPVEEEEKKSANSLSAVLDADVTDTVIKENGQKMIAMVDSLHQWPNNAQVWIKNEFAKGSLGVKVIAKAFADDSTGKLGTQKWSKKNKEKLVTFLLNNNFEQRLSVSIKNNLNKTSGFSSPFPLSSSLLAGIGIGFSVGCAISYLIHQKKIKNFR